MVVVVVVEVVGFDLISVRKKERDNMRKGEVLKRRNGREVKGEMVVEVEVQTYFVSLKILDYIGISN